MLRCSARFYFWLVLTACDVSAKPAATKPPAIQPLATKPPGWLKGQTHAHTSGSGDSKTSPTAAMRWYARHGFDFVVITDHNRITRITSPDLLVLPGVELTVNLRTCEPQAPSSSCLLHMNALFADGVGDVPLPAEEGEARIEVYTRSIAAGRKRHALLQLNHPNFHYSADAALITELARRGTLLLEIANMSSDVNNDGDVDEHRPNTETLWNDALNSGAHIFGVASDDAHHYDDAEAVRARGHDAYPGNLGFIMVHASRDAKAVRAAIERGDFYASSGVLLAKAERSVSRFDVAVTEASIGEHVFTLIADGKVISEQRGRSAHFDYPASARWARVVVRDAALAAAWLQPIWRP